MAKKKTAGPSTRRTTKKKSPSRPTGAREQSSAGDAVERARLDMEAAINRYRAAVEQVKKQEEMETKESGDRDDDGSVGQLIRDSISFVRRHPIPGTLIAAACGFLIGRTIRRR